MTAPPGATTQPARAAQTSRATPPDATETNLEALREWHETFQAAARLRDWLRMEQARLFVVSLMNGLIEDAR